ncbi:CBS domain-containing protein [Actinophytocola sp.]|uniref:CBS domain-containing protein n=1 Tax=Actinophytocola sp. TaxID=1872138 RepID=UPI0025C3C0EA|nr:CBS domain-containing protein [Actinophytocola sp.]
MPVARQLRDRRCRDPPRAGRRQRRRTRHRRHHGPLHRPHQPLPAHTIGSDATVVDAAKLLNRSGIKRLPVIDESGGLVGIVSRKGLLSVFLRKNEDIDEEIAHEVFELNLGIAVDPATITVRSATAWWPSEVNWHAEAWFPSRSRWSAGSTVSWTWTPNSPSPTTTPIRHNRQTGHDDSCRGQKLGGTPGRAVVSSRA